MCISLLREGMREAICVAFIESLKRDTSFAFSKRTGRRLWQLKYYDRILRASDSANSVAWYIWFNPVRKGLCRTPMEYPFSGSFTEVGKKMFKAPMPPDWAPPWKKQGRDTTFWT